MGAIIGIETGEGYWHYQPYVDDGLTSVWDDFENIPKESTVIKLQTGKSVTLQGWKKLLQGGSAVAIQQVGVKTSQSDTEVKLSPMDVATSQIVTIGEVTMEELQAPPTVVYKLTGPEAILELQHTGVGGLKITNQPGIPEPKVIII